jgi:hypothetical protein
MICHNVIRVNAPTTGIAFLTDLNACSHTARQDAENSEDWHCPACNDLNQVEKDTRKSYAEEKEMIKSDLATHMGSGRTALSQP